MVDKITLEIATAVLFDGAAVAFEFAATEIITWGRRGSFRDRFTAEYSLGLPEENII